MSSYSGGTRLDSESAFFWSFLITLSSSKDWWLSGSVRKAALPANECATKPLKSLMTVLTLPFSRGSG
jgi:hypothetical protein